MQSRIWVPELWRGAGMLLAAAVATWIWGEFWIWLSLFLLAYLGWHLLNLARLETWVSRRLVRMPPESSGVWEEIFLNLYRVRQRNKKRHKRIVKRLARFQEAAQALPDAIAVLDQEGAVEWVNLAANRLLGIDPSRDVGQRLLNLVRHPELVAYMTRGDFRTPMLLPSPEDAALTLSVRVVPYGKDQHLFIARDVTQLQKLEKMRRDFIANVSHEIRTPLTVISGYLETLRDEDQTDPGQWSELLGTMQDQALRMRTIVGDLLLLSRLESSGGEAPEEPVDVPRLLEVLRADAIALSADNRHEFQLHCDSMLWFKGSESELRSAFSNLVFNAVRYTPPGGLIDIRWYVDEQGVHFAVKDNGVGIPAYHLSRLTERFYRVDVARSRHTGGTGLGLAIVKHVLQRHGGVLWIDSTPGVGSLFRCDFSAMRATPPTEVAV